MEPKIFSGRSNPEFAAKINKYLDLQPGEVTIKTFKDGEIWVKYKENIRGRDIYIVQSTMPPADNLIELLIMIDAAKRSSAKRVTAIIPYFGYSRQDRKDQPRVSITAKLIANLITTAGADRVISMDLHTPQIQGFFDIPFDHLYGSRIFSHVLKGFSENLCVASPDIGGIKIARAYAKRFDATLIVIDKRRPEQNVAEIMQIIGDVKGKNVLIVDDMIDTGGTFAACVSALKENGALKVYGAVTHPLLSGDAVEKIEKSELEKCFVTDTIPLRPGTTKFEVLTASELFGEAIIRHYRNESISTLFEVDKS